MVTVGFNCLLIPIYWFALSKMFIKLFILSKSRWLFTCVYLIYWINIHWDWNLSIDVFENCMWDAYKPDIWIFSPGRLDEYCGEGSNGVIALIINNWLTVRKITIQIFFYSLLCIFVPNFKFDPSVENWRNIKSLKKLS